MAGDIKAELEDLLAGHGQQHLLAFWDALAPADRDRLAAQIRSLDLELVTRLAKTARSAPPRVDRIQPAPYLRLPADDEARREWASAEQAGLKALAAGRVAAMVVAGGQGTRLGFDGPKGAFPIGPVTKRTLFQIHAEKVLAASRRSGRPIPFLVMTSPANNAETVFFLKKHAFFGLPCDAVRVFSQGEMPAVDENGRLLLEAPSEVFMSPNGHGGALKALWDSGTVEWLEQRGIDLISYFQVDNPLVKVIDPSFIGFHTERGADVSLKLLTRTIPDEKLGIWVLRDGRPCVIEYSDMSFEEMAARRPDGRLKYEGGSIAIHCFSVPFVRRLSAEGFRLPYHVAHKKVPHLSPSGQRIDPKEPNALKFEMFIFDALEFAENVFAVETSREEEFSPVKNAGGADSPETARRDLSRLYARWLAAAGVDVPLDSGDSPAYGVEISPLVADSAARLAANYNGPSTIRGPFALAEKV